VDGLGICPKHSLEDATVIWFFTRKAERTSYEIRAAFEEGSYELIVRLPTGCEQRERFASESELLERRDQLERSLRAEGWTDEVPDRHRQRIH
jgi:hypothetical protein